ncbi:CDP-diacylglycerol--glycerol-3-phosphate 3-phosphatidyltransferase [Methylophaga nitratireducenticrescens]|uniref:CDP-diacylglycerol--glycerol-3-phosphate 3-phosphatidyltransferase n=1 Tax=Methylophaga nitratireducenticrescens TaxID=754476 RepID=I1XM09_METNJ|nr:CDP-diacylglycerol--glycerol-3-phosphate 3-phosphatidyltransferase [Methylophaga nitratireducenticrescens]AFI85428.1 CDP-diacylglycerol--glycerol-3-phosphate 3-phosphatidyltransferase [Methylophaga nitratireducenticrescens]AUZ85184.1 CDP-diacylglycerol--glycerol-3-phosphate 3-phosphatidyltransferase [Methylophaga nitratireducenticrescens]
MLNLPNLLSLLRVLLIPVLVVLYFLPSPYAPLWATIVFVLAGITDWLDGYLARRMNLTSPFGAFIDPVADKLIVVVALLLILFKSPVWFILLPVIVIVFREITISALREWMAEIGARHVVQVSSIGKWKTTFQMVAIGCLIFHNKLFGLPVFEIGVGLLYVAALLTLTSMISYLKAALPVLVDKG